MAEERDDEPDRDRNRSYGRNDDWRQREAVENAVSRAADRAVRQALDRLGIQTDGEGGRDAVQDFNYLRRIRVRSETDEEYQADKDWTRRTRKRMEKDGAWLRQSGLDIVIKIIAGLATLVATWCAGHFGFGGGK